MLFDEYNSVLCSKELRGHDLGTIVSQGFCGSRSIGVALTSVYSVNWYFVEVKRLHCRCSVSVDCIPQAVTYLLLHTILERLAVVYLFVESTSAFIKLI